MIRIKSTQQKHLRRISFFVFFLLVVIGLTPYFGSANDVFFTVAENRSNDLRQTSKKTLSTAVLLEEARISERIFGLNGISNAGQVALVFIVAHNHSLKAILHLKRWASGQLLISGQNTAKGKRLRH